MHYLKKNYRYARRRIKLCLQFFKTRILALFPQGQQQTERTLEVLSSLSYRTGELRSYLNSVAISISELLAIDWTVVTLCRDGYERVMASSIDKGDQSDLLVGIHGTLTETVIETGRCLFVNDISLTREYGEIEAGYCAYIGAPLRLSTGEIIGTICSFHRKSRKFTAKEMRLVEIFAERTATVIDNYNLYQQQQEMNLALQAEINERQEAELLLKKSEEELRQIAENLEPLLWMYAKSGEPIYMSPMFEKVTGLPIEQWYADPRACLSVIHPQDRRRVAVAFRKMFRDDSDFDLEYRIIHPEHGLKIIRDRAFPIIDETGKVYRIAGIAEDITARQQEQQKVIKAMERLSEIGELATTIVHEVRSPLTTVLMGLTFLQKMELPDFAHKRLMLALEEAERLKRLLNEILLYAKHETLQPKRIDLNGLILNLIENISISQIALGRQISFDPLPSPLEICADMDKLTQVVINLLQNACEAISEGDEILVSLSDLKNSNQALITVKNGGTPISLELLPKLTQPFFTTKPSGNGLGLAIVKKIVEAHGGRLEIESTEIEGTTVSVMLPVKSSTD
jgi:PAS domain S-box-containing protein